MTWKAPPDTPVQTITVPVGSRTEIVVDTAGSGPLLVLVHGIGGNRTQWRDLLPAFAEHHTVIAPDLRGYGDSTGPPVSAFADFADDLLRVLDHFGEEPVFAYGHSMGGRLLLEAAGYDPERFAGLILSATEARTFAHMEAADREREVANRRGLFEAGTIRAEAIERILKRMLHPQASEAARETMRASLVLLRADGYLAALSASLAMEDRIRPLAPLQVPILAIGGADDPICPPAAVEALAAAIPKPAAAILQVRILKDVAHMPHLEAPDRVARLVADFIATARAH